MKASEWIAKVEQHRDVLLSFVRKWHPSNGATPDHNLPITAHVAEAARQSAVKALALVTPNIFPASAFEKALAEKDYATIYTLLQEAWMGVPESTSCWRITGFAEAVDLLDDPVEQEEDEQS